MKLGQTIGRVAMDYLHIALIITATGNIQRGQGNSEIRYKLKRLVSVNKLENREQSAGNRIGVDVILCNRVWISCNNRI
jgi:hypothetical protein